MTLSRTAAATAAFWMRKQLGALPLSWPVLGIPRLRWARPDDWARVRRASLRHDEWPTGPMTVELHPAMTHSYGTAEEAQPAFGGFRAAESVQAFDPIRLTRVPGAVVSRGHVVSGDGTILSWGAPGLAAWEPLRKPTPLRGTYLHLAGAWSEGYAHWLLDVLPRLMALRLLDRRGINILASEPFPTWKADSLARAGVDLETVKLLGDDSRELDTLYLVGPVGSPAHCHPLAARWLRETYLQPVQGRAAGRRLYITRRRAATRRVQNETSLMRALEPLGFEPIDAELLSFDEQVEAYRQARIVVGPHGAGLANLVFCPSGTAVVELHAPAYPVLTYEWLSSLCGLRYRSVLGTPAAGDHSSRPIGRQDFTVDLAAVAQRLNELGITT